MTIKKLFKRHIKPIYQGECSRCGCMFEFEHSDANDYIDSQIEGQSYNVTCPWCNAKTLVKKKIFRYESYDTKRTDNGDCFCECKNFTTTTDSKEQSIYESLCTAGAIGYKVAIDDVIESITEVISKSSELPVDEYRKVFEVAENIVTQMKQKVDIESDRNFRHTHI